MMLAQFNVELESVHTQEQRVGVVTQMVSSG